MVSKKYENKEILLFVIAVMLVINTFLSLQQRRAEADTYKLDDCITAKPDDKPAAYLHVVTF